MLNYCVSYDPKVNKTLFLLGLADCYSDLTGSFSLTGLLLWSVDDSDSALEKKTFLVSEVSLQKVDDMGMR